MSTPGTAAWLREQAKEYAKLDEDEDLAEGLIRAANRIDRLQAELAKQKTGVDQTNMPAPVPHRPAPSFPRPMDRPQVPIFRIRLPEGELASDREAHERVFEWINDSEHLGMGLLDPCQVFILGEPDAEGGTWDYDTVIGISTLRKENHDKGFVRITGMSRKGPLGLLQKRLGSIDLTGCTILDVESDNETIIELVAQTVEVMEPEEDEADDE